MESSETKWETGKPGDRSGRKRGKKRGRKKAKEFMDEAYPAHVRYSALQLWREVEEIRRLGITLIGYVRNRAFNVYSHPQRIDYRRPQKRGSVVRGIETAHESGSG